MSKKNEAEELTTKIAEVLWIDTHAEHGWTNNIPEPGPIRSVGYVLRDDDEAITLTESIDLVLDAKRYGCITSVPKSGVQQVKYLKGRK